MITTSNKDSLTIHIRVTKKCNADCSYCSSFEKNASNLMDLDKVEESFKFLKKQILENGIGGNRKHVTIQYVGGEILTVPKNYLEKFTEIVKLEMSSIFQEFKHGAQSNLIGSKEKIDFIINLFEGNIGTSFDFHTEQRTVNGDSKKYKTIAIKNIKEIKRSYGKNISGILVLDKKMAPVILEEINFHNTNKRHLNVRPVFIGGSPIESLSMSEIEDIMVNIYDNWFLRQDIIIDPFFSYLKRRIINKTNGDLSNISGCPSQHNCAQVSLNLEPNGDIYICQDMADSKEMKIGNTLENYFDIDTFNKIKKRSDKLNSDCLSCDYFAECQGGCMLESIQHGKGLYGKTDYCSTWKKLFKRIDDSLMNNEIDKINSWINKISKY